MFLRTARERALKLLIHAGPAYLRVLLLCALSIFLEVIHRKYESLVALRRGVMHMAVIGLYRSSLRYRNYGLWGNQACYETLSLSRMSHRMRRKHGAHSPNPSALIHQKP